MKARKPITPSATASTVSIIFSGDNPTCEARQSKNAAPAKAASDIDIFSQLILDFIFPVSTAVSPAPLAPPHAKEFSSHFFASAIPRGDRPRWNKSDRRRIPPCASADQSVRIFDAAECICRSSTRYARSSGRGEPDRPDIDESQDQARHSWPG